MKFTCPKCKEEGVEASTFLLDDFKKTSRCTECGANLLRRHYVSPLVIDALFGGGLVFYIGVLFCWGLYGVNAMLLFIAASIAIVVVSRLIELAFTKIEDADSEEAKRTSRRNDKIFKVLLWIFVALIAYSLYVLNED